jgi:hypothetical protein
MAAAFKLPGPSVMRGKLAPVDASAKREYERGRYLEVRQQRNQDEVRLEEVRRVAEELLMPRTISTERDVRGGRSRKTGETVVAAPYLQGTEKAPGSAEVLTEALQQAVANREWRELWILLGQIELWLTICFDELAAQPWWMLSVVVTAEHGTSVVNLAGGVDLAAPRRAAPPTRGSRAVAVADLQDTAEAQLMRAKQLLKSGPGCEVHIQREHEHQGRAYRFWTWNRVKRVVDGVLSVELPAGYAEVPGVGMVELGDEGVTKQSVRTLMQRREVPGCEIIRALADHQHEEAPVQVKQEADAAAPQTGKPAANKAKKAVVPLDWQGEWIPYAQLWDANEELANGPPYWATTYACGFKAEGAVFRLDADGSGELSTETVSKDFGLPGFHVRRVKGRFEWRASDNGDSWRGWIDEWPPGVDSDWRSVWKALKIEMVEADTDEERMKWDGPQQRASAVKITASGLKLRATLATLPTFIHGFLEDGWNAHPRVEKASWTLEMHLCRRSDYAAALEANENLRKGFSMKASHVML